MYPREFARLSPDKPAYVIAESGVTVSYGDLEDDANRGAHLFRSLGLARGDVVAILLENCSFYFKIVWAAQRAGLYLTCLSNKLSIGEVTYILDNSAAKVLVSSRAIGNVALSAASARPALHVFMVDGGEPPFQDYKEAIDRFPTAPIADESPGGDMLYSSGTTGRPKGVKPPLPPADTALDAASPALLGAAKLFGLTADTVYLSPAPLYHASPLRTCMLVQRFGGTCVLMEKFDAEAALLLIEKYHVTFAQWVPTHFIRMLKLPPAQRRRYDVSSLKSVIHAAAPCPVSVKEEMIAWWGPIIDEFYGGTEDVGSTFIASPEWLTHKGSVGRAIPPYEIHICDERGAELPRGAEGLVYFSGGRKIVYHDDPEKSAAAHTAAGWSTLGDVGVLDEEGYLYLRDRKDFMIISGGVNIYPQEIENLMLSHPAVMDAAVFGIPDEEMGERVVAIVQPADWQDAGPALAEELTSFTRSGLSHVKAPRKIVFQQELPRTPAGKLVKRLLREKYIRDAEGS